MLQALEGSQAVAQAVALCRPQVIAAYPITPQTHIVENISKLVADGKLRCEFISVESEFSAASVVLGAALAGSRAYTASASQGILLMAEVLFNIAGMRVPIVMTCANRAVSSPLSIWNDQQDSMAVRDAGWIQLYCADNQEAVDTTIQAYRIAERTELPVMVCMDGFTLTHTLEGIDIPNQKQVDAYLPPYQFSRTLDPRNPISLGTLVGPDFYTEARHSHHQAILNAQAEIVSADQDWLAISGRKTGGLLSVEGPEQAKTAILAIGSVLGTLRAALRELPPGEPVKLIKLRSFRPFPTETLKAACKDLDNVIVLERALSPGSGGIIGLEVLAALSELPTPPRVHNFAAGLGGRDIPLEILPKLLSVLTEPNEGRFKIIDVDLEKLPVEDR
ncbi:MAG: pyruvate ferredoxin oxidoreductase [Candidatus Parabeggiatoa sp. nov. 3]|nr:MAG: pyruvate ferredoxin oxidoreductase [Gammaproteobacteria bacterium]RKZ68301.1 MAG: pyruvate ferredoxin oxidoreductase [Gammaproteobacteria bacterium]RKZ79754.1 MAG: pyruvate ferredoxin oxidoreductase [Gammaproteobacteria bacterium]HEW97168.1 pyruvate ferredoxin oxidoreductase [Beggiatoa sp.]